MPDTPEQTLRRIQARQQGSRTAQPEPGQPEQPGSHTPESAQQGSQPAPAPPPPSPPDPAPAPAPAPAEPAEPGFEIARGALPRGLLSRFPTDSPDDLRRYHARPWLQLADETQLEFALFTEYLLFKLRDLDLLPPRLNEPAISGWFDSLIATHEVPAWLTSGESPPEPPRRGRPAATPPRPARIPQSAESRALWWLSGRNFWPERARAWDLWDLERLADIRRIQIREFAQEIDKLHIDHIRSLSAILQEVRAGVLENLLSSKGMLARKKETRTMIPSKPLTAADGSLIKQGPTIIEMEHDPLAQIRTMYELADRLFGPLPHMLDGDLSAVLDKTLTLPPLSADGPVSSATVSDPVPAGKRGNAPWLLDRLNKVQVEMEARRALGSGPAPPAAGK